MKPDLPLTPAAVHATRWLITTLARSAATIFIAVGAYLVLKKVAFAIGSGQGVEVLRAWTGVGEEHSFYRGSAMLAVGLPLFLIASRLSRLIVRVPTTAAPDASTRDKTAPTAAPSAATASPKKASSAPPEAARPMGWVVFWFRATRPGRSYSFTSYSASTTSSLPLPDGSAEPPPDDEPPALAASAS